MNAKVKLGEKVMFFKVKNEFQKLLTDKGKHKRKLESSFVFRF